MKIRLDFVTNSSSSSFIFGEPGKISSSTKESIINGIKKYSDKIFEMIKLMDDKIKSKDNSLYDKVLECRELEGSYYKTLLNRHSMLKCFECKEFRDNIDKCSTCIKDASGRLFQLYYHTKEEIEKSQDFKDILRETINKYNKELNLDETDYEVYFIEVYLGSSGLEKIKEFLGSDLLSLITDFKEPDIQDLESYSDARELLEWYSWDNNSIENFSDKDKKEEEIYKISNMWYDSWCESHSSNCDKNCDECMKIMENEIEKARKAKIDINRLIFNHLGEYGIYGLWEGDVPYLIVLYLYKVTRLSCNHMG